MICFQNAVSDSSKFDTWIFPSIQMGPLGVRQVRWSNINHNYHLNLIIRGLDYKGIMQNVQEMVVQIMASWQEWLYTCIASRTFEDLSLRYTTWMGCHGLWTPCTRKFYEWEKIVLKVLMYTNDFEHGFILCRTAR